MKAPYDYLERYSSVFEIPEDYLVYHDYYFEQSLYIHRYDGVNE